MQSNSGYMAGSSSRLDDRGAKRARGITRSANTFALLLVCLVMVDRLTDNVQNRVYAELPLTVALFVLPMLYVIPRTRPVLDRYRWAVLVVQAVLSWAPFAVFGFRWQLGIGGLLAGLVLVLVPGRRAWALAGLLLAADVALSTAIANGPMGSLGPRWYVAVNALAYYVDDCMMFFGPLRLAQIVENIEDARDRLTDLAVSGERLQVARSLQAAVGERVVAVAAWAASARLALRSEPARARALIAAAGVSAREAAVQARRVAVGGSTWTPSAGPARAVIGVRLARTCLLISLCTYGGEGITQIVYDGYQPWLVAFGTASTVLCGLLLIYHARYWRAGRRPRYWPVTLTAQGVLAYAFAFPFVAAFTGWAGLFFACSVLLLIPGPWRWAGFVAVVASYSILLSTLPALHAVMVGHSPAAAVTFFYVSIATGLGLLLYSLAWLASLASRMEGLQAELAGIAAVRERTRAARDVHDLLGLGLATIALKADLIGRLIGRDDRRADAEIEAMCRVCAATRADIRLVAEEGRLSLAAELGAAKEILASAGIDVDLTFPAVCLPDSEDAVLAPVLREAVTNVLRHSDAVRVAIRVATADGTVTLRVRNDGSRDGDGTAGRGLLNLTARLQAVGGRLACTRVNQEFTLTAEIPNGAPRMIPAVRNTQAVRADDTSGSPERKLTLAE